MKESLFRHAQKMVCRNRRSYQGLLINLVFTFFVLLCLLFSLNSFFFQRTKTLLVYPSHVLSETTDVQTERDIKSFCRDLAKIPGVRFYQDYHFKIPSPHTLFSQVFVYVHVLPERFPGILTSYYLPVLYELPNTVTAFQGKNSCFLEEQDALYLEKAGILKNGRISVPLPNEEGRIVKKEMKVQALLKTPDWRRREIRGTLNPDHSEVTLFYDPETEHVDGVVHFAIPDTALPSNFSSFLDKNNLKKELGRICIFTHPYYASAILELGEKYQMHLDSGEELKRDALHQMTRMTLAKYVVGILAFVIFFFQISTTFQNAVKERRYEVALRRALGASPVHIALQLFFEFISIFIGALLLSWILTAASWSVLRMFYYYKKTEIFTFYMTGGDVIAFFVMAVSMVSASLIVCLNQLMKKGLVENLQGVLEE